MTGKELQRSALGCGQRLGAAEGLAGCQQAGSECEQALLSSRRVLQPADKEQAAAGQEG